MIDLDNYPTAVEVARDLYRVVHELERWQRLPLPSLRALPSVIFYEPSTRLGEEASPRKISSIAIKKRIGEAIQRTEDEKLQGALSNLFTFDDPQRPIGVRHEKAAEAYGVTAESFRTSREKRVLRDFSEELMRGELIWAVELISDLRDSADA